MNLQINSVNFSTAAHLNHFIKKKIKKLFLVTNSLISADIYLKIDKPKSHNNKVVEIKLRSKLGIFFAKKNTNSFEESIILVSKALKKQIIKNKKK
tara:strand:+ start:928 stop:1215 length:288 start_codon:yes stop_codon:yes gene_type:complete